MRISSRLALAGSVVVMVAAATGVALSMPGTTGGPAGPAPELTASAGQQDAQPQSPAPQDVSPQQAPTPEAAPPQAAPPEAPPEPDPVETTSQAAQPLTGEQIAALAATPARERAATLIAKAQARAERERDDDDDDDESQADKWDELRDEIREACDDGRIRGAICGDA